MSWLVLLLSGVFEAVWAVALDATEGFKRLLPTIVFLGASILSLLGLGFAMREIPTGTAYAVWTGVGAALTVLWSVARGKERANPVKIGLIVALILCVAGLKVVG